jgi:hypothetical protein
MNTARRSEKVLTTRKQAVALYVDRSIQRWVVRDLEGNFWLLPDGENAWDRREPYLPTEEPDLEPIPGHYKSILGLPL